MYGQWHETTLELTSGETVTGLGKIKGSDIKFKYDEKAKVQKMNHRQVRTVSIAAYSTKTQNRIVKNTGGRQPVILRYLHGYVKMPYSSTPRLLPIEFAGKRITVYSKAVANAPVTSAGRYSSVTGPSLSSYYYVIRDGEETATIFQPSLDRMGFNSNVSYKSLREYFADCEHLLKMLEDKFIEKDLMTVVKYYDEKCE